MNKQFNFVNKDFVLDRYPDAHITKQLLENGSSYYTISSNKNNKTKIIGHAYNEESAWSDARVSIALREFYKK